MVACKKRKVFPLHEATRKPMTSDKGCDACAKFDLSE